MEKIYKAYSKEIGDQKFYFVKECWVFPEFDDVSCILKGYGMHTDFNKACQIANIEDPLIKEQLALAAGIDLKAVAQQAIVMDSTSTKQQRFYWFYPFLSGFTKWKRQLRLQF